METQQPNYNEQQSTSTEKDSLQPANWDGEVAPLLEKVDFPKDTHERADFVEAMFANRKDREALVVALHEVLVPGVDSVPNERAGIIRDSHGEITAMLASPEEREEIGEYADSVIQQVIELRKTKVNDQAFLDRMANIVGLETVLKHTMKDGNGRVSRVAAHLIAAGPENPEWDNELGGAAGAAMRLMASGKEARHLGRDPNRIDTMSDGFIPLGFIPAEGMSACDILRNAAAVDIQLDNQKLCTEQYASAGMVYGLR